MPNFCLARLLEAKNQQQVMGTPNGTAAQHLPEGSRAPTGNRNAKPGERKAGKTGHAHEKNRIEKRCRRCHGAHGQLPAKNAQKRANFGNPPGQPRRVHAEGKRSRTTKAQIRLHLVEPPRRRKSPRTHAPPQAAVGWVGGGRFGMCWIGEDVAPEVRVDPWDVQLTCEISLSYHHSVSGSAPEGRSCLVQCDWRGAVVSPPPQAHKGKEERLWGGIEREKTNYSTDWISRQNAS
eukprot:scaffold566_cov364-Pavlova_lutheri.AAC.2